MTEQSPWSRPDGGSEPAQPPGGWAAPGQPPAAPGWATPDQRVPPTPAGHVPGTAPTGYPPAGYPPAGYPPAGYVPPPGPTRVPRKNRTGLWIGLGIGAFVLVCCLAVPAGIGGVVYLGYEMDKRDTVVALEEYLDAVKDEDYDTAYDLLCDDEKTDLDQAGFAKEQAAEPRLVSYDIGEMHDWVGDGFETGYEVDVEVTREGRDTEDVVYVVFTDDLDLDYQVCEA